MNYKFYEITPGCVKPYVSGNQLHRTTKAAKAAYQDRPRQVGRARHPRAEMLAEMQVSKGSGRVCAASAGKQHRSLKTAPKSSHEMGSNGTAESEELWTGVQHKTRPKIHPPLPPRHGQESPKATSKQEQN